METLTLKELEHSTKELEYRFIKGIPRGIVQDNDNIHLMLSNNKGSNIIFSIHLTLGNYETNNLLVLLRTACEMEIPISIGVNIDGENKLITKIHSIIFKMCEFETRDGFKGCTGTYDVLKTFDPDKK